MSVGGVRGFGVEPNLEVGDLVRRSPNLRVICIARVGTPRPGLCGGESCKSCQLLSCTRN
jgi:hypothetical protein